jgi:probable rRNA maturation factor
MSGDPLPKRTPPLGLRILVSNRQELPIDEGELTELARRTLAAEGKADTELSLSFVSPAEMADLHLRYLGEAGPTDVLAFPLDEEGLLGDVVVCPAEAGRSSHDLPAEMRLLVVHGILHLLGYDHEEDSDRRLMWDRQEALSEVRP